MLRSMLERHPRPDWVRRINAMGDSVGGAENLITIDAGELIDLARSSTGLEDFGDFDGDWRGRLEALVRDMNGHADLSTIGRLMSRQEILRCLRTRLFMTRRLAEEPGILDEEVGAPIIVSGQARSGTTILFELLALDPNARSIAGYESAYPVPETEDRDALLAMTECEQELWCDLQPEYASIHEHRSDLPVECITPTMASFGSMMWFVTNSPQEWAPDFVGTMQFHKVFLQLLQYGKPRAHWVLKTPTHLPVLDLVFTTYPEAWIVLTHRDPMKTIPSGLSTLSMVRWQRANHVDLESIAQSGTGMYDLMVDIKRRRDEGSLPDRFVDLHFLDLMRDPPAAIREAYATMALSFDESYGERIQNYIANKPRGKFGTHRYDVADWGFSTDEIRERTRSYVDAYGVMLEEDS